MIIKKINNNLNRLYEKLVFETTKSTLGNLFYNIRHGFSLKNFAIYTTYKYNYPLPANEASLHFVKEILVKEKAGFNKLKAFEIKNVSSEENNLPAIPSLPTQIHQQVLGKYDNTTYQITFEEKSLIIYNVSILRILQYGYRTKQDSVIIGDSHFSNKFLLVGIKNTWKNIMRLVEQKKLDRFWKADIPYKDLMTYERQPKVREMIRKTFDVWLEFSNFAIGDYETVIETILKKLLIPANNKGEEAFTYFSCVKDEFCFWLY